MIETYGHQTIEKTHETVLERIEKGPIKSTILDKNGRPKEKRIPFAGDGYYFWEDNLSAADWWGNVQYLKKEKGYRVFRIDIRLKYDDGSFFDLVGNIQHMKILKALIERIKKQQVDSHNWKMHNYLTYFRLLEKEKNGIFPYKMLRFNDSKINEKIQEPLYMSGNNNRVLLNPFYIICVFNREDLLLPTFKHLK